MLLILRSGALLAGIPLDTWVIPLIGLLTAGLTLAGGRFFLRRRRVNSDPTLLLPEDHDPFSQGSLGERRAAARRKGNHVEILLSNEEGTAEPTRGWVVDRSMGGLMLLLSEPADLGSILSIKPRHSPPGTPWVRVEIRTCTKSQEHYEIGCQFQRTPPWSVMLLFG